MIMKKVIIFGQGDFARVAEAYLSADGSYEVVAFTVHQKYITDTHLHDREMIAFEDIENRYPPDQYEMLVAIGFKNMNHVRAEIYNACKKKGYVLMTYVHPQATVWKNVTLGDNCFIFENNVIQPFVTIGNNVILWSGNHIGHDATIGDHCFVASHAVISGRVKLGSYCFVGVNATIRDGVSVAPECLVGAGALILNDTKEREVFAAQRTHPASIHSDRLKKI